MFSPITDRERASKIQSSIYGSFFDNSIKIVANGIGFFMATTVREICTMITPAQHDVDILAGENEINISKGVQILHCVRQTSLLAIFGQS